MAMRLGDVLVERGIINEAQRDEIIAFQRLHGRPFGLLAEQMFGVDAAEVEQAWAEQYASMAEHVALEDMAPAEDVRELIERRQAWQFGVVPLKFREEELVIATSTRRLAKAMRFSGWWLPFSCAFVICEEDHLRLALAEHFPIPGMAMIPSR